MIISPPFLPNVRAGTGDDASGDSAMAGIVSDSEWIESVVVGGKPGDGGYPLSYSLGWHGGIHLNAQLPDSIQALPVRAIADGTIVYLRVPQPEKTDDKDHPLMYRGEWTDDGCVIIRHETDIGEGANAKVAFFSIYLHLSTIDKRVQEAFGKRVYRKDKIGIAGKIYGTPDRIHFEIICDDTNLKRLIGRNAGPLDTLKPARTDAIYGDTHLKITAGADLPIVLYASESPTAEQTASPIAQITEPLYVRIRLRREGPGEKAGTRYVHTYREVGLGSGKFQEIGKPISSDDFEYSLYSRAVSQYPKSPSAGYDLLRFGRVIGPDALSPSNAPLWVRINAPLVDAAHPDAPPRVIQGYVNLHSNKVLCFSDADFPHWVGWTLIQDDKTPDSLCNSPTLRRWLDRDNNNSVSHKEAVTQLTDNGLRKRLNRAICKFHTEWEKNNIATRWSWLMSPHEALEEPLSAEAYSRFERHHKALAFWEDANLGIDPSHWHFHPREFISHFRKALWLSEQELAQIYPDRLYNRKETPDPAALRRKYLSPLNHAVRKYSIQTTTRLTHFLGQGSVESFFLARMVEASTTHFSASLRPEVEGFYNDPGDKHFQYLEGRLGNTAPGDGMKFRGRGMKQLTGRENYSKYWVYRGWSNPASFTSPWWGNVKNPKPPLIDDPQRLSTDPYNCIDAGAWYWEAGSKSTRFRTINLIIVENNVSESAILNVTLSINGGKKGSQDRINHTLRIFPILNDIPNIQ